MSLRALSASEVVGNLSLPPHSMDGGARDPTNAICGSARTRLGPAPCGGGLGFTKEAGTRNIDIVAEKVCWLLWFVGGVQMISGLTLFGVALPSCCREGVIANCRSRRQYNR